MKDPFVFYDEYIRTRYGALPGFGTLNLAKLVAWLDHCGLKEPLVMAPFNAAGFHMNPSQPSSERVAEKENFTLLAMNVLASGALGPKEAFEYLKSRGVGHAVVGAATPEHITETFGWARKSFESVIKK
jgi:hypothetical protein